MAVPAAPLESGGAKVHFWVRDNAGTNVATLPRGYKFATVNGTELSDLGVYPTSGTLENGGQTLAAGTAEQISTASLPCQGVIVKAAPTNIGPVYVGKSDVTTDYADSTGGFPLEPGESVGVPCRNANEVYIRGTTGDKVAWLASAD